MSNHAQVSGGRVAAPAWPLGTWGKMGVLGLTHFLNDGYAIQLSPILVVLAAEFGLSVFQTGLLITAFNVANTVFQFPASLFTDVTGRRRTVLAAGLFLTAASVALYGISPTYGMLLGVAALGGLASAAYHPCGMAMVSHLADGRKGFFLGIYTLTGSAGAGIWPLLTGLLAVSIGWRAGMWLLAVPGIVAALVVLAAFQDDRLAASQDRPSVGLLLRTVVYNRALLLLALFGAFNSTIFFGAITFLPFFLEQRFGWGPAHVGLALFVFNIAAVVSQPLAGHLSDRGDRPLLLFIGLLVTGIFTALIPFLTNPWAVVGAAAVMGAAVLAARPLTFAAGTDFTDPRSFSSTIGFLFTSNMLFGSLSPMVGGLLERSLSLESIFWVYGAMAVFGSFFMLKLRRFPKWEPPPA